MPEPSALRIALGLKSSLSDAALGAALAVVAVRPQAVTGDVSRRQVLTEARPRAAAPPSGAPHPSSTFPTYRRRSKQL
jgi:hypothetical protein